MTLLGSCWMLVVSKIPLGGGVAVESRLPVAGTS
jgi:hypothetical protein